MPDDTPQIHWYHPGDYPSRCSPAKAQEIAESVMMGVAPKVAAAAAGVMPNRFRQWLKWGFEAYSRDAGPDDYQAPYLNLYLMVNQAIALAALPIQQRIHARDGVWWLKHSPETRSDWADLAPAPIDTISQMGEMEATVVDANPTVSIPTDVQSTRTVARMLIEAGAALPDSRSRIIEADRNEGGGEAVGE